MYLYVDCISEGFRSVRVKLGKISEILINFMKYLVHGKAGINWWRNNILTSSHPILRINLSVVINTDASSIAGASKKEEKTVGCF